MRVHLLLLKRIIGISIVLALLITYHNVGKAETPENGEEYYTYVIIDQFSHDPQAFTQGLVYSDGFFYEGTGLYGQSSLRKTIPQSGEVLKKIIYEFPPSNLMIRYGYRSVSSLLDNLDVRDVITFS